MDMLVDQRQQKAAHRRPYTHQIECVYRLLEYQTNVYNRKGGAKYVTKYRDISLGHWCHSVRQGLVLCAGFLLFCFFTAFWEISHAKKLTQRTSGFLSG